MAAPTIEGTGGVYALRWEELGLTAHVDRLREDSRHVITAEVRVVSDTRGHLHQARFNLTSTTSRLSLARQLLSRLPGLDWDGVLEQLSVKVIREYRKGEPVVVLDGPGISEQASYLVDPLIRLRVPNLLFGTGGSGKTTLALYLAALVQSKTAVQNGFNAEPGVVLYLDYEPSREDLERPLRDLEVGNGLPDSFIFYRRCYQPFASEVESLRQECKERNVTIIIVDSLALACGGEPESSQIAVEFFRALRSLEDPTGAPMTAFILHHKNREGGFYGNIYWWNYSRNIWEIIASEDSPPGTLVFGLYHRKYNNTPKHKDIGLMFEFEEGTITLKPSDIRDDPTLAPKAPPKERIKAALRSRQPMKPAEIAKAIGDVKITTDYVYSYLKRGRGKDFTELPVGWVLLAHESEDNSHGAK